MIPCLQPFPQGRASGIAKGLTLLRISHGFWENCDEKEAHQPVRPFVSFYH
jgi:hypothetical protein